MGISKSIKKARENEGIFDKVSDKKQIKNIKTGVSTVLLIAGAVLAIGLAFKVVGSVNFAAVISLSIAMPLIAIAFSEIASSITLATLS